MNSTRHIRTEFIYAPGGDIRPPTKIHVSGPGWQQTFMPGPQLVSISCPFQKGDIVRVRRDYSNTSWVGARGVVIDINEEGILVEFGVRIDTSLSARRFPHSTTALEPC